MRWNICKKISKKAEEELNEFPKIVRQLLFNRGIQTKEMANTYFSDEPIFYDPEKIPGLVKAANDIYDFIKKGKKIFIHGDFDADGITATSILWDFLYREMHADVLPYIPNRFDEGYGMSDKSIGAIKKQGGSLIISVDCGIKDDLLVKKWLKKGINFIITDHHEIRDQRGLESVPEMALSVVHPNLKGSQYPFKAISGAAVVWKLISFMAQKFLKDVDTKKYLDLVAISTICDVMPLIDENRSFVKAGIKEIRKSRRIGLIRLINDSGLELENITSYHIAFVIGPRLNASGRLEDAMTAVKLLTTKSLDAASNYSNRLVNLNSQRQQIQEKIYNEVLSKIGNSIDKNLIFVWDDDWEEGVIGIVAGKLSEKFNKPVLIATKKDGNYTGSARSIPQFNIIEAINQKSSLLIRFGGHSQAAGFTVNAALIDQFRAELLEIANQKLSGINEEKEKIIDAKINLSDIDFDLVDQISKFEPFGLGNVKPRFLLENVSIFNLKKIGSTRKHLSFDLFDKKNGKRFRAIGFNLAESIPNNKIINSASFIFSPERNSFNGNLSIDLYVEDIKFDLH